VSKTGAKGTVHSSYLCGAAYMECRHVVRIWGLWGDTPTIKKQKNKNVKSKLQKTQKIIFEVV